MATASLEVFSNFVVVGGGIAGVSCAEQLSELNPTSSITLITSSTLVKAVTNFKKVSRTLETFEVDERASSHLTQLCPNVTVVQGLAQSLDILSKTATVFSDDHHITIRYDQLCICSGAVPNLVIKDQPYIIGIRDTESVKDFQDKVKHAKRIIVIGNGGIAIELVYEIKHCQVVWAIKDSFIGNTFFDEGAAKFFLNSLKDKESSTKHEELGNSDTVFVKMKPLKRMKYMLDPLDGELETTRHGKDSIGSALGPDWCEGLHIKGSKDSNGTAPHIEYTCQMECVLTHDEMKSTHTQETYLFDEDSSSDWPVYVKLSNGKVIGCDLIVSATGVVPNTQWCSSSNNCQIKLSDSDGGILVDSEMRTNCPAVYAAGDVCSVDWQSNTSNLWFQMRLWSQARQMGSFAAQCMTAHKDGNSLVLDFCFEIFSHVTKFFGFKVVLLGLYNCQGLDNHELLLRITEGTEYVKVILKGGRMVGAILIGDTDLEETFENLMLNQMDLSSYKDSLLDPDIDIEDYFD